MHHDPTLRYSARYDLHHFRVRVTVESTDPCHGYSADQFSAALESVLSPVLRGVEAQHIEAELEHGELQQQGLGDRS